MTILVFDVGGTPHQLNLMEGVAVIRVDHMNIRNEIYTFDEHGFYLPKEVVSDSPSS